MKGKSLEKSIKGMGTALRKIRTKAIPSHVFHFVFVGKGRNGAGRIISVQSFVEENEICKTPADTEAGFLK